MNACILCKQYTNFRTDESACPVCPLGEVSDGCSA